MNRRQARFTCLPQHGLARGGTSKTNAVLLSIFLASFLPPPGACADLPPHVRSIDARIDRDFGHVMGAKLVETILVESDPGYALEVAMLPQPGGALNDWLEVRDVGWREEGRGNGQLYRITITYQVFKGVREAEILTIPALPLRFRKEEDVVETEAPPQPFTLNPLIPPGIPDEEVSIRGLHAPPAVPDPGHGTRLGLLLAGLTGLLLFAARHLGLPPFRTRDARPFDRAVSELRKLRQHPPSPETWRYALRLFHSALNDYARRTVLKGQLPRLFHDHPEFAALRGEMETLFALSHRLFFASDSPEMPADYPLSRLEALCRQCRAIDRRRR